VRRSHLFEGDRTDNAADKVAKGRQNRKLDDAGIARVLMLKSQGLTQTAIARQLGVSDSLVSYVVRVHRVA
jgi:DNA invertase Pin-like site-specific DNA recombinase